ncbi:hypothetical protein V6N11_036992 [Hibiscus sabdariffa]|uniref:Uncharacterized protein n=1 Tax=Hibiscus sabdariffa TaxID=183260 RepID=A0ABR2RC02_9ROSI
MGAATDMKKSQSVLHSHEDTQVENTACAPRYFPGRVDSDTRNVTTDGPSSAERVEPDDGCERAMMPEESVQQSTNMQENPAASSGNNSMFYNDENFNNAVVDSTAQEEDGPCMEAGVPFNQENFESDIQMDESQVAAPTTGNGRDTQSYLHGSVENLSASLKGKQPSSNLT